MRQLEFIKMSNDNPRRVPGPFITMLYFIAILWMILFLSVIFPLNRYGIIPRSYSGLPGILLAPFLHLNSSHLIANSLSLLVLGSILLGLEKRRSLVIALYIIIGSGLGTWLIGRPDSIHIGASGLIYGIMAYLFFIGIFRRNIKTVLVSIIVFLLYGGAVWGILPVNSFISWESHLCGFLTGIIIAKVYSNKYEK
jgi:membrane associated rhomboid family serine protease